MQIPKRPSGFHKHAHLSVEMEPIPRAGWRAGGRHVNGVQPSGCSSRTSSFQLLETYSQYYLFHCWVFN